MPIFNEYYYPGDHDWSKMMKNREPKCSLNHEVIRRELREKDIPSQECSVCGWEIRNKYYGIVDEVAPPLTEEQIEYIKERLKNDKP
jgi:hypothetical protein